jgi:hypothetical protein
MVTFRVAGGGLRARVAGQVGARRCREREKRANGVRHIIAARDEARPRCAGGRVADASLPEAISGHLSMNHDS